MTAADRWRAAAAGWSCLYRAGELNATQSAWSLEQAAKHLARAGLLDLAQEARELADNWTDDELRPLMDRAAEAAGKLELEATQCGLSSIG